MDKVKGYNIKQQQSQESQQLMEKIKMIGEKLEKTAERILLILCIGIFCGLAYYSARYTVINNGAIPLETWDNAGLNLLVLAVVTAVAILLHMISRNTHLSPVWQRIAAWRPYLIGIVSVYVYMISVVWVVNCHIAPVGDGEALCSVAHRMMLGNFVDMKEAGYMFVFPHQYSLLSVIHLIYTLVGPMHYEIFQHINALCMPLLFYSGYKLLWLICEDLKAVFYYILFFLGCVPLFLYVPYVYGEIISITFTMVLMWQIVRYCKAGKKGALFWGTIAIVIACFVRKNSLIVLIATGIILTVHSIRKGNPRGVIWIFVMVLMVSGSDKLIHMYYEKISGLEVSGGIPYVAWVRMGMQDNWTGPGWFDNSSVEAYAEHGYDTEQTTLTEKERLSEVLKDMWQNKADSIDFLRRKILSQWNSPAYSSFYETENFDYEKGALPDYVRRIYYDNVESVKAYMNKYQFMLYFYTMISAIVLLVDRRKRHCLQELLLYVAIVGGFLFSIFWEASDRYVLPYVVYMIPMASIGISCLTQAADKCIFIKRKIIS